VYVGVPPLTVRSTDPVVPPKQFTSILVADALSAAAGCVIVNALSKVTTQVISFLSLTCTLKLPAIRPVKFEALCHVVPLTLYSYVPEPPVTPEILIPPSLPPKQLTLLEPIIPPVKSQAKTPLTLKTASVTALKLIVLFVVLITPVFAHEEV
jgi:hypothetical protein